MERGTAPNWIVDDLHSNVRAIAVERVSNDLVRAYVGVPTIRPADAASGAQRVLLASDSFAGLNVIRKGAGAVTWSQHKVLALAVLGSWASGQLSAQNLYGTVDGPRVGDGFASVIAIEDLNADGVRELVVGAIRGRVFGPGPPITIDSGDLHWYDGATLQPLGLSVAGEHASGASLAVTSAGDFDRDGITDILWHHYSSCACSGFGGYADVHSGATGAHLARFTDPGYTFWGEVLGALGDVNQDGFDDVGVGSGSTGVLHIYGGPTGQLIRTHTNVGGIYNSVASKGDLDGDGVADYVYGSASSAAVRLFSGATGQQIRRDTRGGLSGFGWAVTGIGDIDGDGVPDYAGGAAGSPVLTVTESGVHLVSGATGHDLAFLPSAYAMNDGHGGALDASHDVNGDGVRDLIVGCKGINPEYLHVYSLRTRSLLWRVHRSSFETPTSSDVYFHYPRLLGDLDGDGLSEWCAGSAYSRFNGLTSSGRIWIFRGGHGDVDAYCPALPNSLGRDATLRFQGPITVGHPEQRLVVERAVSSSFAQLFYGTPQMGVPFGDGLLCAGGQLFRLGMPFALDTNGVGTRPIDWTLGPHLAGPGAWLPGSAFGLQVVYRDVGLPGSAGFNTTNALRIVFND